MSVPSERFCALKLAPLLCVFSVFESKFVFLNFISVEPSTYCPRRPRSTSEAVSLVSRDDICKTRSKEGHKTHPPKERYNSPDSVHSGMSVSPPQPEEELDLCPPAAGISSLDFDPMSFQCSQPSATPRLQQHKDGSKWRKSAGCSSESEPISSPNNNILSPDISPVLCKGGKMVGPLSPALGKEFFKLQGDNANVSASPPPLPSSSPPVEKFDAPLEEGRVARAAHPRCSPLSTASQASALTDLSQSAQNLPDPGK